MFNNISNKIKVIAKIMCGVGIGFFVLAGIGCILGAIDESNVDLAVTGFMCLILGVPMSWVWSCLIYGFGQLIENTNSLNGVQVAQDEDEEEEQEKKSDAIMKDIAAWYLSNIDEDDERKKVIEEYIKKH